MPYTPEQIAAFVGAAAWLPQLATWVYRFYRKPEVVIIPDTIVELGYTTLGPIFNIRLAVSADVQDVLLDGFKVKVRHESGDTKTFNWRATKETLNQIRDVTGIRQTVEKEETGIAVKVRTEALVDKFFKFQDDVFTSETKPPIDELNGHFAYLRTKCVNVHKDLMDSQKMHALLSTFRSKFSWRTGKYVATFSCNAINSSIVQKPTEFNFQLSTQDIEHLRQNFDIFAPTVEWSLFRGTEGKVTSEPVFNWVYTKISR